MTLLLLCLLLVGCQPRSLPAQAHAPAESPPEAARPESYTEESQPASPASQPSSSIQPQEPTAQPESEPQPDRQEEEAQPSQQQGEAQAAAPRQPEYTPAEGFGVFPLSDRLKAYITGSSWQEDGPVALEELRHVTVLHYNFEGEVQAGELIVHKSLAAEVADIFLELYNAGFPIHQAALVEKYGCDDRASMEANNSSCFNMRKIAGTDRWSRHSYGAAVDLNPLQNPYVTASATLPSEEYLERSDLRSGMIAQDDVCHQAFVSRGWTWGGDWANPDYQHFEKSVA